MDNSKAHVDIDSYIKKENAIFCIFTFIKGYIQIKDEGVEELTHKDIRHIKQLWLNKNNISQVGMKYFPIADWSNLTHLNLSTPLTIHATTPFGTWGASIYR
jgi:hypothetical protein